MPPFLPHTHVFLGLRRSADGPATKSQRTIFILSVAFWYIRRRMRKREEAKILALHRDASFMAGTPSVIGPGANFTALAHPKRVRRASARRTRTRSSMPRPSIPSLELGSVFRLDATLPRSNGSTPARSAQSLPSPVMPSPKLPSPHQRSLFSNGSTLVGPSSPRDKYNVPPRVMNPPPLTSPNTNTTQTQNYRKSPSPSRERLVRPAPSVDSLASTPPLSPDPTSRSQHGIFVLSTPMTDVITPGTNVVHKTLSKQSMSSLASSQRTGKGVEQFEPSPYLVGSGLDYTPFSLPTVQESSPPPTAPLLGRYHSADDVVRPQPSGTPVTLSHFPFRFSHSGTSSPRRPSVRLSPPPPSHLGAQHPVSVQPSVRGSQQSPPRKANNNSGNTRTLPHSMPAVKLKIRHAASDEIIAIAFAPHTINFRAVRDAIRTRLNLQPRRIWSANSNLEITDDTSLWSWLDEQYTKGHTRLILQAE
ncbi:hypothetical protein FRC07_005653 [Ceratobasidium sp. 392]|nr:hypothetical protein FRC07_005653 [Ceratobasidium sp. 392]